MRWRRDFTPGAFATAMACCFVLTTSPMLCWAWLALLQCGARVLPLNPQLPAPQLAELLPSLGLRHALVLNGGDLPAGA